MTLPQAKSEPAGKRVPDRRDGDSKKEKAGTSDRYCCRPPEMPLMRTQWASSSSHVLGSRLLLEACAEVVGHS